MIIRSKEKIDNSKKNVCHVDTLEEKGHQDCS